MATVTRTIRLRKRLVKIHTPRRLKKSIDYLREDIARHSKSDVESVRLSLDLNSYVMDKVARHMKPVKITVEKIDGLVKADLAPELKQKPKTIAPATKTTEKKAAASAAPAQKPAAAAPKAKPAAQRGAPERKPAAGPATTG